MKHEKNLLIDNEAYAKEILKQTSYYSLIGGYKDIFKNPTTKKYKDGTRFTEEIWKCSIVGTYECFNIWKYIKNVYAASTGYTNQSQQELSVCQ